MKHLFLLGVLVLFTSSFHLTDRETTIFIAGDSTAQTYKEEAGLIRGWGQMLENHFDGPVKVANHAIGGRSTKTFINEGRWEKLLAEVQPGDYVFIQFGHNDASSRPERHASHEEYEANLIRFVSEARAKKAIPVLLTSVVMRTFKNGALVDDRLKAYPALTRKVAEKYEVPLIDIHLKTRDFILLLGDSASIPYYRWVEPGVDPAKPEGLKDDTHMMEKGATQVASFVAEGIKKLGLKGLAEYVND